MWDGRELNLFDQAVDATHLHAEATQPPTPLQQQQIVAFEGCTRANTPELCAGTPVTSGVFTAQIFDQKALSLLEGGATGGPTSLAEEVRNFFIGINDPLGLNPTGAPFSPEIFDLYDQWASLPGGAARLSAGAGRLHVARRCSIRPRSTSQGLPG
jgi:hypothetical protein